MIPAFPFARLFRWQTFPVRMAALALLAGCSGLDTVAAPAPRPNIILFIADDVSWNDYGCYGSRSARTPHIDQLAATGIRFTEAYLTASSCSPSRSSIITGRYPHNNGHAAELHRAMPWHLVPFPAVLRDAGYYTVLSGKNHMTWDPTPAGQPKLTPPWHHTSDKKGNGNSGGHSEWIRELKERPKDQPFFFWFASHDAHRAWDGDLEWDAAKYGPKHQPADIVVPPFLADDLPTRQDLASYQNEVTRFDHFIGEVVKELKVQNVFENTLIFVLADNGRPFPRAKTRVHDSGMKTALIAHWPAGISQPGRTSDRLVSTIDLAPTCLLVAGATVPASVQGLPLLPLLKDPAAITRRIAFSEHNWHDYEAYGRSVRADGLLYLINRRPNLPWQGPADSVASPSFQSLRGVRDAHQLTPAQADVFLNPRPEEELYETAADPNQLHNLAGDPRYAAQKQRLAALLAQWQEETADSVPAHLSPDTFDRETGKRLKGKSSYGTTPGEDRDAPKVNRPGPR